MTFSEQIKLSQELEGARNREFYWMNQVHTLELLHPRDPITFELSDEVKSTDTYKEYEKAQAYVRECKEKSREFYIKTLNVNESQLKRLGLY